MGRRVQHPGRQVGRLVEGPGGRIWGMVTWALVQPGPQPSGRLLAVGGVALGGLVTVVLILVAWRRAVVGVQVVVVMVVWVGVVMVVVVVVVVVAVVVVVVVVGVVVVVVGRAVSPAALASYWRASSVADRRVTSLWHVVGVWSAAGGQLPGTNGGGRSGGRGGV